MFKLSFFRWIVFIQVIVSVWAFEMKCGIPGEPLYGTVDVGRNITEPDLLFSVGDKVTYECEKGDLFGEIQRICEDSGRWSGTVPICDLTEDIEKDVNSENHLSFVNTQNEPRKPLPICGSPDKPANGTFEYMEGENGLLHAIFNCSDGYYLSGDGSRTCDTRAIMWKDKKWSGDQPVCKKLEDQQNSTEQPHEKSTILQSQTSTQVPEQPQYTNLVNSLPEPNHSVIDMNERSNKSMTILEQPEKDKTEEKTAIANNRKEMDNLKKTLNELEKRLQQLGNGTNSTSVTVVTNVQEGSSTALFVAIGVLCTIIVMIIIICVIVWYFDLFEVLRNWNRNRRNINQEEYPENTIPLRTTDNGDTFIS